MSPSIVLDFDGSVGALPQTDVIPLAAHQEAIRFGCSALTLKALGRELSPMLETAAPVVFMGSGDFHHVSYLLIERMRARGEAIQVVVFDNHPDNMRYPFGIHCGSWVWHVSRLPFVKRVHVVGISSTDVEAMHLWENHLAPLYSGKVRYWCVQRSLRAMRYLGIRHSRSFHSVTDLLARFLSEMAESDEPIYLSIDKDVLAGDVVRTNWDQGVMRLEELTSAVEMLRGRLIATDVVGDVSSYRYRSRFKRFLSARDGQHAIPSDALFSWQAQHRKVNEELLSLLRLS